MVFGNLGHPSGSGVAFTRDPLTGDRRLYGEYLAGGQGEEVVAGTRTPTRLDALRGQQRALVAELEALGQRLEAIYRDALDLEFTVERGKLYLLQVRPAKRTAAAAIRIAGDLADEGLILPREALDRLSPEQVKRLVRPEFDAQALARAEVLARGTGASPGHASGVAVLDADRAAQVAASGARVILVRPTTSPQDLRGMLAAEGIVTARGGATSHAAVVSRALDKPCVVGCEALSVDPEAGLCRIDGHEFREGAELSIDGSSGSIYAGIIPTRVAERQRAALARVLDWAQSCSGASVWLAAGSARPALARLARPPAGLAIIAITDLLIAAQGIAGLIEAIGALSADGAAPSSRVEHRFERDLYLACCQLFEQARGLAIDLRVPNLTSARARRMIAQWTGLAPSLLLPLGAERLLAAYARAAGEAARATGHTAVTLLIGGITSPGELDAFTLLAQRAGGLSAGAVLQNPVVLFQPEPLVTQRRVLWVELHELVRTSHGFPEEFLFADEVLRDSGQVEAPSHRPRTSLAPLISALLDRLVAANRAEPRCRVGIDLGGTADLAVVAALYRLGFRHFTSPPDQVESLSLLLGQSALRENHA